MMNGRDEEDDFFLDSQASVRDHSPLQQKETSSRTPSSPKETSQRISSVDLFDPLRSPSSHPLAEGPSLLDSSKESEDAGPSHMRTPGSANFLEMETEPLRHVADSSYTVYDPLTTSSGLFLTHRRTPLHEKPSTMESNDSGDKKLRGPSALFGTGGLGKSGKMFEIDTSDPWRSERTPLWSQGKKLLTVARLWILLSGLVLLSGLSVVFHHIGHETSASTSVEKKKDQQVGGVIELIPLSDGYTEQSHIVLVPMAEPDTTRENHNSGRRLMADLRGEFNEWVRRHNKSYASLEDEERRFSVWVDNHHRTREKNLKHGPCSLTKRHVFGSNHLQDLTEEEFKKQYLTGYTGPKADMEPLSRSSGVLGPHITPNRHPDIHRRLAHHWKEHQHDSGNEEKQRLLGSGGAFGTDDCSWYDISCILAYYFDAYFYGLGRTMEPGFDADSYPSAVDWRDVGAVGEVRKQGDCGACWAVTAIETIESALFIAKGTLYELSESEVILCTSDCEMCMGGWPQEAVEYVMENKGVPLLEDVPYDGSFLLEMTYAMEGSGDEIDGDTYSINMAQMCPSGGNSHSGSGSNDNAGYEYQGSSYTRYGGDISGYGYATQKCVCYTDGTGCDCDSQNEGMAVRNVATYGPAVVCFDASTWQDYDGGIITSDSGCSSSFMDVNHCAQVVGYAFTSGDDDDENRSGDSKSGSNDHSESGSKDDSSRSGYWIVRNQWSTYWGMSGYAYVAMGDNTCGILNDMLIAYT